MEVIEIKKEKAVFESELETIKKKAVAAGHERNLRININDQRN